MRYKTVICLSLGFLFVASVTAAALTWYVTDRLDQERQRTEQARLQAERATRLLERLLEQDLTRSLLRPLPPSPQPRDLKDLEQLLKDLELLRKLEDIGLDRAGAPPGAADAAFRAAFQGH
jgi:hypothetical protein